MTLILLALLLAVPSSSHQHCKLSAPAECLLRRSATRSLVKLLHSLSSALASARGCENLFGQTRASFDALP
eukprot:8168417-Alexandrium_andersonii.AAC.1